MKNIHGNMRTGVKELSSNSFFTLNIFRTLELYAMQDLIQSDRLIRTKL